MKGPSSILPDIARGAEVLVIRLRSLGDIVLLTPVLSAIKRWRPDLILSVMVEEAFAPVLEGNPDVNRIVLRRGFMKTAREIRRRRYAIVFNQHGGPTSALLAAASGSPVRVCWKKSQFSFLYNVLAPRAEEFYGRKSSHTVEGRLTQFYWTGLPREAIPPSCVYPQADAVASARRKIMEKGVGTGQAYAVIHPCANFDTKTWSLESYGKIVSWLGEVHGISPVVILGPGDGRMADRVMEHLGKVGIIIDSFNLRELIALMSGARIFVGNDSGPAHVAAAAGTPVVVVFGSSDSAGWRPWKTIHRVVKNDYLCSPCPGMRCETYKEPRCILSVTVDQVREACAAVLREAGPGNT